MGRPRKEWAGLGFPPLREYWRECNRYDRAVAAWERAKRKARDKKRRKCRCDAYKFPHRPGGGLCRYPDPPAVRWQDAQAAEITARVAKFRERFGEPAAEQMSDLTALTTKPCRPYRNRYAGILRQIARNNGLHPIRDRAMIEQLMPRVMAQAKSLKRQYPRYKFKNMEILENGVRGVTTTAGPEM